MGNNEKKDQELRPGNWLALCCVLRKFETKIQKELTVAVIDSNEPSSRYKPPLRPGNIFLMTCRGYSPTKSLISTESFVPKLTSKVVEPKGLFYKGLLGKQDNLYLFVRNSSDASCEVYSFHEQLFG